MNAIVTLCNDNYVQYTKALIKSFYYNNNWFNGDFVILCDDMYCKLSLDNIRKLRELNEHVKIKKCLSSDYYDLIKKYEGVMLKPYYKMVLYKFEIFRLTDYDKILFLDSDIIVNGDISDLFSKEHDIVVCRDYKTKYNVDDCKINSYFNSGVIFLGNKKLISKSSFKEIIDFANQLTPGKQETIYGVDVITGRYTEQDILNLYFYSHSKYDSVLTDSKFNSLFEDFRFYEKNTNDKKIIHFLTKPGVTKRDEYRKLWEKYNNLSQYKYRVICLMTSWTKRIKFAPRAIKALINQTRKPDCIYLTLSTSEFPNKEKDLPKDILELVNDKYLKLYWVDENTKTIKKIFPIIDELNDEDIIMNCDDDIDAPKDLIASRLIDFEKFECIHPITTQVYPATNAGIVGWAPIGVYKKKMLNGWHNFINDEVISTYEDDGITPYIFALNGYKPITCSKYKCPNWPIFTHEYAASASRLYNPLKTKKILDKRVEEIYGFSFYDIVNNKKEYEYLSELGSGIKHKFSDTSSNTQKYDASNNNSQAIVKQTFSARIIIKNRPVTMRRASVRKFKPINRTLTRPI